MSAEQSAAAWVAEGDGLSAEEKIRFGIDVYIRSIKSRRLSLGIEKLSMGEFRSRAVICPIQSYYLLTKIHNLSNTLLSVLYQLASTIEVYDSLDPKFSRIFGPRIFGCLERFMSNMVAAEDLLYLCAQEDWKLSALSVFLPASRAPCHSRFALVARDLDCAVHMFFALSFNRQFPTWVRSDAPTDASYRDRSIVLHKLEGGPITESIYQEVYGSLLTKRFQEGASPSTPSSIPDWCWIPGQVKYIILDAVASGNFKSVLKCKWLGLDAAIAVYKGEYAKNDLEAEAGILASVQHPNVVSMFGCSYDDKKQEGYLVTELMEQDLRQLIRTRAESRGDGEMPFSESVARDIILQIVEAMIHIHKCRVLHRDLKPANCLVSARKRMGGFYGEETYYVVKVIDFGASKLRGANASTCHTRKQGTTAYMAPELHAKKEECAYKWPADVYSLGMTMYEILTGKSPFEGVYTGEELARRVCAGERPSLPKNFPFFWKQLMERCCHRDPRQRPTFAWIRLEILRGISSAAEDPVSDWKRLDMPSEINEEFLENSEGFEVNPSLLYKIVMWFLT